MTTPLTDRRDAMRTAASDVAPMLIGIIPFGLVAGAVPVAEGLGVDHAVGFSTLVFAGASQLAAIDALTSGAGIFVAAFTAWTINLRMLLYSASLAPYIAHEPVRRRLPVAYLLVDQTYAFAVSRWKDDPPELRLPYFLVQGVMLWSVWNICTLLGAVVGNSVPDEVPLSFALPLVFLVLLVPTITSRPALAAAVSSGVAAVTAAELGATNLAVAIGAVTGITVGASLAAYQERPSAEAD